MTEEEGALYGKCKDWAKATSTKVALAELRYQLLQAVQMLFEVMKLVGLNPGAASVETAEKLPTMETAEKYKQGIDAVTKPTTQ